MLEMRKRWHLFTQEQHDELKEQWGDEIIDMNVEEREEWDKKHPGENPPLTKQYIIILILFIYTDLKFKYRKQAIVGWIVHTTSIAVYVIKSRLVTRHQH